MKIVNGRWVNDFGNPLEYNEGNKIKELGQKVKSIYGNNITFVSIEIVICLTKSKNKQTTVLELLENNLTTK